MRTAGGVLLCLLAATLFTTVLCNSAVDPSDCCFNYRTRTIHKKYIASYFITDTRCPQPGVILTTKKLKTFCVNQKDLWVQTIMDYVDKISF